MNGRKYSDCTYCAFYNKKDTDVPCVSCVYTDKPSNYKGFVWNPYDEKARTAFMEYVMGTNLELNKALRRARNEHT